MSGSVDGEHGFQIAPMLDILFVLLLFFMVSAGAQKHEIGLTTQLPGKGAGSNTPIELSIDSDGQVSYATAPIDGPDDRAMPTLVAKLQSAMTANASQPVVVTPTRSTKHQRVVDVLNACSAAGVKNLAFGTPPE